MSIGSSAEGRLLLFSTEPTLIQEITRSAARSTCTCRTAACSFRLSFDVSTTHDKKREHRFFSTPAVAWAEPASAQRRGLGGRTVHGAGHLGRETETPQAQGPQPTYAPRRAPPKAGRAGHGPMRMPTSPASGGRVVAPHARHTRKVHARRGEMEAGRASSGVEGSSEPDKAQPRASQSCDVLATTVARGTHDACAPRHRSPPPAPVY